MKLFFLLLLSFFRWSFEKEAVEYMSVKTQATSEFVIPSPGDVQYTIINAAGEDFRSLNEGDTLNLQELPEKINIRCDIRSESEQSKVITCLRLNGIPVLTNFDYAAPYLLIGDEINSTASWRPVPGVYTITSAATGAYTTIRFTIIDSPIPCQGKVAFDSTLPISMWGDSFIDPRSSWTVKAVRDSTGYQVIGHGIGGQTSLQIRRRMIADTPSYNHNVIIWAGRNNYRDSNQVRLDIKTMVSALAHDRYLILDILNGDYVDEHLGQSRHPRFPQWCQWLEDNFPGHVVHVREFLVRQYNPALPKDLIDFKNDVPPSSLRYPGDPLHLNKAGGMDVAHLIKDKLCNN